MAVNASLIVIQTLYSVKTILHESLSQLTHFKAAFLFCFSFFFFLFFIVLGKLPTSFPRQALFCSMQSHNVFFFFFFFFFFCLSSFQVTLFIDILRSMSIWSQSTRNITSRTTMSPTTVSLRGISGLFFYKRVNGPWIDLQEENAMSLASWFQ